MVDIKTGDWLMRRGERQARESHQPTPCHQCPKRSPANEAKLRLSPRNQRTVELYYRAKAGGLTEDERNDPTRPKKTGDWPPRPCGWPRA